MIISPHEQRSPEWFQERLGLPTASMFAEIITTKGKPTTGNRRQKYLDELAGEVLSGRNTVRFANKKMRDASEREPDARLLYEIVTEANIQEVGLCYLDEQKKYGASPDGLINPKGGFETKDAEPHVQVMRRRTGWTGMEHFQQIQGGMYVCEREWWDLQSYCEGMQPIIIRFWRDDVWIEKLKIELDKFCLELIMTVKKLKEIESKMTYPR